ncbi:MAG: NADH-quinone oxidoreductase subunit NuoG [Ilumatobacteraceae bacterium]|nr:NADH-quinone oxidoreductase subunit NuoG [Ilumatobacteraceae bacterium]
MTTTEPTIEADVPAPDPNAVNVTINGVPHVARKGQLVIEAAADAGEYIPRFCYHERMTSVGKCRMCLVECDSGRGPAVTVSCMVPVAPDMKIDTQSPTTKRMQEGVLELLLANHPLDCPVCDKGGECPLQDQAFSNGPGESRYVEEKRHYEKPIAISDIVYLDRERCILCDRCTRFADEVAGDALIHFSSRGNNTYITTFPDEPFSSYFSGNTVQICPVGALTAKPYRFKARPWDLSQQETTCTTCAVGCRTVVQSSRDEVLRYMGVDSDPVNHGWLCDRGRFNFEAVKSEHRVLQPLVREGDELLPASWNTALAAAAALITEAKAAGGVAGIAVIGGARGTNEDAFAWARVGHEVIGTPNVYSQMGDGLPVGLLGLDRATIDEAANATTIVLLGPDLKEELPVLYLRLRDAAAKQRSRIIELTPKHTGLTRNAWRSIGYEPGTQVAAVQGALADGAIAAQLAKGNVVIVAGRANLAESSAATIAALHALLAAVPGAKVLPAFRRGNVVGALQVGVRPGKGGLDTRGALQAAADGKIECLVLLGADPLADFPDTDLARRALAGARRIIAVDTFLTQSSQRADVVLAASAYAEKSGTTTNLEGRVSTVARQVTPAGSTRPDWMIATELALVLGGDLGYGSVEAVTADIAAKVAGFESVTAEALAADGNGVLAGVPAAIDPINVVEVDVRERNAYDFRLVVSRTLYDQATGTANSPSLAALPRGSAVHLHPLDLERVGTTAGTDVKVIGPRSTVVFTAVADETVLRGTAFVPFNNPGPNVGELIDCFAAVNDVRIENL